MSIKDQKLAQAIYEYLQESTENGAITDQGKIDGLKKANECIAVAFGLDTSNSKDSKLSIQPAKLSTIFDVFLKTQSKVQPPIVQKASVTTMPKESNAESLKKAEDLKSQGNKKMAAKDFAEAIRLYSEAIQLDGQNPVYYANRAAAYSQNGEHQKAVDDSKSALVVDEKYSKAYSRMGHAYFCLGKFSDAVSAYEKGLELDPENAVMKQSLDTASAKAKEAGGHLDTAGLRSAPNTGAPGGGFDLASMMSNPNFMQMASQMMNNPAISQMMQNPAMAQMAQSMMSDPNALQNMMRNPEIARLAQGFMGGANSGTQM